MVLNWLDKLGDWNPQLLRELKGRLKTRNLLIAGTLSLLGQLLLFLYFYNQLPVDATSDVHHPYCTGNNEGRYGMNECLRDVAGNIIINWQHFWIEPFACLSLIGIFALLVIGSYMLIADLTQEERRGTLNFVRLSPQSTQQILVGKLLGVPILLYLVAVLAIPLHLWAGLSAQIPLGLILGFYVVLIASCIFFYSAALLYGLIASWLGGFQAFLGSGAVFIFLCLLNTSQANSPANWLQLFLPQTAIQFLEEIPPTGIWIHLLGPSRAGLENLQWFYLPLSASTIATASFVLLNYSLWTYWIWQALKRCFRNPNTTWLSKRQSYLLVACFEVTVLGFVLQKPSGGPDLGYWLSSNLSGLLGLNLLLFLCLIAALSPDRQTLQDWARYRRERTTALKSLGNCYLIQDLIWSEKSPALVAIAINLLIASTILLPWILLWSQDVIGALFRLILSVNLILIYAAIAQLMLTMRQRRALWATAAVGGAILLPPILLAVSVGAGSISGLWLFSVFPLVKPDGISTITAFLGLIGQWSILGLLSSQLSRQLRQVGESSSKALFSLPD